MSTDQQSYTQLVSTNTSGFTEPAELVIRDQGALDAAWKTLYNGIPGNPAPHVDLGQRTVVLLASGARNSGGYAVHFDRLAMEGGTTVVHYTVTTPGPNCMNTQMLTSPVEVVSVPRVDGAVRFERRSVMSTC